MRQLPIERELPSWWQTRDPILAVEMLRLLARQAERSARSWTQPFLKESSAAVSTLNRRGALMVAVGAESAVAKVVVLMVAVTATGALANSFRWRSLLPRRGASA